MSDVSEFDRTRVSSPRPASDAPGAPALAGVECCRNHPGREGIGPPIEPDLPDGHVLDGRFVIREAVGRSEMATVYRAGDRSDRGRDVAVKILLARVENDPVLFGRFQREERIGSALSHPGLIRFIPVPGEKSRPYIAMEYLDGCTLAYVLHLSLTLPERDALKIAAAVCDPLEYLHGKGVIHRDIKPSNIMVCRDGTLRLMDLGLAEELQENRGFLAGMTPLFGTPEYMSPEQVRNKRNDERSDIYSLGVVLYQMLAGVLPFAGAEPWAAAQMRVTGDPVAPREVNPRITAQSEEIVLRAMRRRPAERYETVARMRADLDSPERVHVTGLSGRLRKPRFRLSLEGTPVLSGLIIGFGILAALILLVYVAVHSSHPHRP